MVKRRPSIACIVTVVGRTWQYKWTIAATSKRHALVTAPAGNVTAGSPPATRGGWGIPLPLCNPESKKQFDTHTRDLSETLSRTLREQFNREIASGKQRLEESLAPYTRFVRIESERVAQVKETLESLRAQTHDLRQLIDGGNAVEFGGRAAQTQPRSRSA
jgi:hypothetical protein